MTQESATAFAERISTDEAFRDRLTAASTPEERRQIAGEAGFDVSRNDLPAIRGALGIEELSDEDLEKVAGGMDTSSVIGTVMGSADRRQRHRRRCRCGHLNARRRLRNMAGSLLANRARRKNT